jgi:ribosomal protein S18 acetylase RimI-like enzyme
MSPSQSETLVLGAVAYDPRVVTIWEGFKVHFVEQGLPFDYILFSNYERQVEALLASWEEYARGAVGASFERLPGVAAAVFPRKPERGVYNNALIERGLGPRARLDAIEAMEEAYASAGVTRFAAWAHESDVPLRDELERRGYALDTRTRAMGMALSEIRVPRPDIDLGSADWAGYLELVELPPDFLSRADPDAFRIVIGRLDGANVATALAYELDGDCGIYNVGTLSHARRRGLGTALTALLLHEARDRGCSTASLQSTPMAEGVYAAVGFRDLGEIHEYVPGGVSP